jgi:hypothetical protein
VIPLATVQAFQKQAATRQLKIMRSLFNQGRIQEAEQLARKLHQAGALKVTGPGSSLKSLGSGAEGVAHAVIGAKDAPVTAAVRKTYDRGGALYSKEILQRKMDAGRALRGNPAVTPLLSKRLGKGSAGGRYTVHGLARGDEAYDANRQTLSAVQALHGRTRTPLHLHDVVGNPGNTLESGGSQKIIDYIPVPKRTFEEVSTGRRPWQKEFQRRMGLRMRKPRWQIEKMVASNVKREGAKQGLHLSHQVVSGQPTVLAHSDTYGRRALARMWQDLGATNATASDMDRWRGVRRADPRRALRGLGRGSRQAPKVRGAK